ncbi:MAG: nucleotide exchange factor GrpE [Planctomycetales bacterium]
MKWLHSLLHDPTEHSAAPPGAASTPTSSDDSAPPEPVAGAHPEEPRLNDGGEMEGRSHSAGLGSESETLVIEPTMSSAPSETNDGLLVPMPPEFLDELRKGLNSIRERQGQLGDDQRALSEMFTSRLRSDDVQARAVEKLHDELRGYKTAFVRQQMLPLLKEVIFCHDFVSGELARLSTDESASSSESPAVRALAMTGQMLLDLLFKYDVEPFRSAAEQFDPKTQQCMRTVPCDRAELDKTIAARGLTGFCGPEAVIRREQVSVYKHTPGAN